nr:unnamed protein product [Spirometra erinaceieuropaei]
MDGVQEAGAETQSFPSRLPSTGIKTEEAGPDPGHGYTRADGNSQHLRHAEIAETALERPPRMDRRRAATHTTLLRRCRHGFQQKGAQDSRHKDTLKTSLKCLQINPANWEDLTQDRLTKRKTGKTGATIYEVNCITTAKAEREADKFQLRSSRNAKAQQPPTCPRCPRTFRAPVGLVGHLRTNCDAKATLAVVS